ncbi:MAG TPA: hypothetical protein VHA79_09225 [Mycobacteriales bacterium]|nr:hypothetical protein [Mycobacteriales bacterium]
MSGGGEDTTAVAEMGDDQYLVCPCCKSVYSLKATLKAAFEAWDAAHSDDGE